MARVIVELHNSLWVDISDMTVGEAMEKLKKAGIKLEDIKYTVHYLEGLKVLPEVRRATQTKG
jgi:hypothetical protein